MGIGMDMAEPRKKGLAESKDGIDSTVVRASRREQLGVDEKSCLVTTKTTYVVGGGAGRGHIKHNVQIRPTTEKKEIVMDGVILPIREPLGALSRHAVWSRVAGERPWESSRRDTRAPDTRGVRHICLSGFETG